MMQTPLPLDVLSKLKAHMDGHIGDAASGMPDLKKATADFHTVWPEAKPVLQVAASVVTLIPNLGPGSGVTLTALISVGDQLYAAGGVAGPSPSPG